MNPPGKCLPLGPDCSMRISANFVHFYPLKKSCFCSVWHGPLSRGLPFEHSSSKMGTLAIELVYSTLCPSITSTHSTSKFCFNTFQYSVGGAVMPDAVAYIQDCTLSCDPFSRQVMLQSGATGILRVKKGLKMNWLSCDQLS